MTAESADSHWEQLDCARMWAVVDVEQPYSCTPLALLRSEAEAVEWIERARNEHREKGDESRYLNTDYYQALPVRSLAGEFWNSYEPIPEEP